MSATLSLVSPSSQPQQTTAGQLSASTSSLYLSSILNEPPQQPAEVSPVSVVRADNSTSRESSPGGNTSLFQLLARRRAVTSGNPSSRRFEARRAPTLGRFGLMGEDSESESDAEPDLDDDPWMHPPLCRAIFANGSNIVRRPSPPPFSSRFFSVDSDIFGRLNRRREQLQSGLVRSRPRFDADSDDESGLEDQSFSYR